MPRDLYFYCDLSGLSSSFSPDRELQVCFEKLFSTYPIPDLQKIRSIIREPGMLPAFRSDTVDPVSIESVESVILSLTEKNPEYYVNDVILENIFSVNYYHPGELSDDQKSRFIFKDKSNNKRAGNINIRQRFGINKKDINSDALFPPFILSYPDNVEAIKSDNDFCIYTCYCLNKGKHSLNIFRSNDSSKSFYSLLHSFSEESANKKDSIITRDFFDKHPQKNTDLIINTTGISEEKDFTIICGDKNLYPLTLCDTILLEKVTGVSLVNTLFPLSSSLHYWFPQYRQKELLLLLIKCKPLILRLQIEKTIIKYITSSYDRLYVFPEDDYKRIVSLLEKRIPRINEIYLNGLYYFSRKYSENNDFIQFSHEVNHGYQQRHLSFILDDLDNYYQHSGIFFNKVDFDKTYDILMHYDLKESKESQPHQIFSFLLHTTTHNIFKNNFHKKKQSC